MPIYCFVPGCTTTGTNGLHRFPANRELKIEWMKKTQTTHLNPSNNSKVCRKHFKDCDLRVDIDGKRRLEPNAVPSLFLPEPSTLKLNWDHTYHSITSPKKRRFLRLKPSEQSGNVLDDNVGNEIEIGADRADVKDSMKLGSVITIDYLRSLEHKIQHQAKLSMCT
ncbi:uncharacterized protein LOC119082897 [Bradysia coprophila]|uniref:uncharacterized protein LOC119082897 n=1 Tax=Bradysia coprophila TaxID=38358 RepID=UPI00187DAB5A|nr:uncharacterized protein LOC119082897 [Bradysia coprophila]